MPNKWYKLDLSAIVYPTLQRRDFSSVYRISFLLKDTVDPQKLQIALDRVLKRFPTYKVAIRKGLFWRYFEPNNRPGPFVEPDISNPCMPMPFKSNNRYMVRVYYHENRISFEAHHSLGDGNGAACVTETLLAEYLRICGHDIKTGGMVMDLESVPEPGELEDAYMRYAQKNIARFPKTPEPAYRIGGTKEESYTLGVIDGIISLRQVKEVSKNKYHVTINDYLVAALLQALIEKQKSDGYRHQRPVRVAMPVNLRRFFPSITLRNFITMVYPGVDPRLGDYSFEELVENVHNFMKYFLEKKFLQCEINKNAATQYSLFVRLVPLFIKDFVVRNVYASVQDKTSSAGITNMGALDVPEDMRPFIDRVDVYMGQPFSARTNCAIVSYGDVLTINFASSIKETEVERLFFKQLVKDGIHVKIESNRQYKHIYNE